MTLKVAHLMPVLDGGARPLTCCNIKRTTLSIIVFAVLINDADLCILLLFSTMLSKYFIHLMPKTHASVSNTGYRKINEARMSICFMQNTQVHAGDIY